MKKIIFILSLLIFALTLPADAAIGSQGLIINNGITTITMQKGARKKLWVKDRKSGLLLFGGVHFYSDRPLIASVDRDSGILRANARGTAHITVANEKGDCGALTVHIKGIAKKPVLGRILILAGLLILLWKIK